MDLLALLDPGRVEAWVAWGGPLVIFALLFACGLGLPLPEDIPLLLGGYFVSQGQMNLAVVSVLAWAGIIGGDCVLYALSRRYGMGVTRLPMIRHHVTERRIRWAERKFAQYGVWVVAICRLFAGVRGAMVIAAGAIRFDFRKFVLADGIAALISGGLFVALGYFLGRKLGSFQEILASIEPYKGWVIAGLVLAVLLFVAYVWWRSRRPAGALTDVVLERAGEVVEKHVRPHHPPLDPDPNVGTDAHR